MVKQRIIICDENLSDLEEYATLCRSISEAAGVGAEFKRYTSLGDLMIDMDDEAYASLVSIMIVDPDGSFEQIPYNFRKSGYDGLLIYLTRSEKKAHWLRGYDMSAYNYVLKGPDEANINRFRNVFRNALDAAKQLDRQYLVFSSAGVYKQIEVKDILFFQGLMNHVVCVEYRDGKFEFRSEIKNVEDRLSERGFVRVHRSFVVAIDAINTVGYAELTLTDGRGIPIGRRYQAALKAAIERSHV